MYCVLFNTLRSYVTEAGIACHKRGLSLPVTLFSFFRELTRRCRYFVFLITRNSCVIFIVTRRVIVNRKCHKRYQYRLVTGSVPSVSYVLKIIFFFFFSSPPPPPSTLLSSSLFSSILRALYTALNPDVYKRQEFNCQDLMNIIIL